MSPPLPSAADELVAGAARALDSLGDAVDGLTAVSPPAATLEDAGRRGHFRPGEEEELLSWFARFLTVRTATWEVLSEVSQPVGGSVSRVLDTTGWRCFVLGYTAACLVVALDRALVEAVATASPVQRKLNEGSAAHRIPRKQFTAVYESFTDPAKARLMEQAMRLADRHRPLLEMMAADPLVGRLAAAVPRREAVLDPSRRRYLSRLLGFLGHSLRRRGASARQQALFAALEASGRVVSELHDRWTPPRVDDRLRAELAALLRPGDVLVTRHERAASNLFLPGYWPHAALHVGDEEGRRALGVELDAERARRWSGDRRVLEALKDGVLFRPLEQTLAVDAVAVIRPRLGPAELATALARVALHEGKGYNFDFDFFRSDRLVCTEVVYRAYDGVGGLEIPLHERSGRPTLAAEDLLDLAVAGRGFEAVAVCGVEGCRDRVEAGPCARELVAASYSKADA